MVVLPVRMLLPVKCTCLYYVRIRRFVRLHSQACACESASVSMISSTIYVVPKCIFALDGAEYVTMYLDTFGPYTDSYLLYSWAVMPERNLMVYECYINPHISILSHAPCPPVPSVPRHHYL